MAAAGRSPASSGRRSRRRRRGWTTPRKNARQPPSSTPDSASAPALPSSIPDSAPAPPLAGPLPTGAAVEVRVDDDGFHGSWFEAEVLDFSPARGRRVPARYKVTYSHLVADDGGGVLSEYFAPSHVRPRPPPTPPSSPPLGFHDIVEAFHHDGWWSGIVVAAPAASAGPVTVAFPVTREVIPFPPNLVRPRRDYVAGEWVPSRAVVAVRPKRAVKMYSVGEKVEVGRNREVFGYSWFPATVTKVVDPLSYVVEYFDQEVEGDAGAEKATEYLHWCFMRPAVEHVPRESEFRLGPGAAVEAYCDGAWSPGIVRRVVGDGEYEVSVDGKEEKVLVTKVVELLKPQYKWNGNKWTIVIAKRQANLKRRSMSGRSPNSLVDVASSEDEHNHYGGSSATEKSKNATKRPRKEPLDVSISEMDIPLTAFKSQERNCSLYSYSRPSEKNILEVIPSSIGQTLLNEETLPEELLDGQLNAPTCGTGAGSACKTHPIAELRKKMVSARKNSAIQQTQELQEKHDASDNSQLVEKGNLQSKEIICALTASVDCQASSTLDKQVSRQTRSGSNKKFPVYKKSAKRKASKKLSGPHSSLDPDSTVQQRGREDLMGSIKSCTQQDLDRSLEDTYKELLPLIPPGFESMYDAQGSDIRGSLLNEELTNGICQANRNGGVPTAHAATQVSKSNQLMSAPMLPLDRPIQQDCENYQNAGSSHSTVDNSKLRRCSEAQFPSPHLAFSQISGHQDLFVKKSPVWSIVEAMDLFKEVPQQPHFLPLREYSVELREGMALGLTVAFATLVENVRKASIEDSMEFFKDKISTLCQLEGNGFNVQFLQSRLTKLLQIKSDCSKYLGAINKLSGEMVGKTSNLTRMDALLNQKDEAIGELEQQLGCLRQEAQQIEKDREREEDDLLRLKSKHSRFEEAYGEGERQFRSILDDLHRKKLS